MDKINIIQEYLNTNVSKIIIDYLTPLPTLPFLNELLIETNYIYNDIEGWRYYENYVIKYNHIEKFGEPIYPSHSIGYKIFRPFRIWNFLGNWQVGGKIDW